MPVRFAPPPSATSSPSTLELLDHDIPDQELLDHELLDHEVLDYELLGHVLHLNHYMLNLTINHLSLLLFVNHCQLNQNLSRFPNFYQHLVYKSVELEYQLPTP